jgi:alpha-tubulin suppressor-like RCC1 family protein
VPHPRSQAPRHSHSKGAMAFKVLGIDVIERMLLQGLTATDLVRVCATDRQWHQAAQPALANHVRALLGAAFALNTHETWLHALSFAKRQAAISRCKVAISETFHVTSSTLGLIRQANRYTEPQLFAARGVVHVACFENRFAAVTQSGKLLLSDASGENLTEMGGVLGSLHVVSVSLQVDYAAVVTRDGWLFTFGRGAGGKLGHGTEADELLPRRVTGAFANRRVLQVSTGEQHSAVLTTDGHVFTFGTSVLGALGHGKNRPEVFAPQQVQGVLDIVSVAAGLEHTVLLTASGAVFTFGWNRFGQLGYNRNICMYAPEPVQALEHRQVASIAAGRNHTILLTTDNVVLTFGYNECQQLGRATAQDRSSTPGQVLLANVTAEHAIGMAGGSISSGVLTASGRLVKFGASELEAGTVFDLETGRATL